MVSGASAIVGGAQVAKGGGEIASGVASTPETAGASIVITAKGGIELKKGVEKLDRAWDFGKKAAHSYEQYRLDKETFEDIEGASKSGYYYKGKKEVPKGSTMIRKDVRNVNSEEFKEFIRSQGKSFKSNEWKKVMETWKTPDGEYIEVHYWRSKAGEIWSHK